MADLDKRRPILRLVYSESVVYLLRLLFVLYAEDRGLFDEDVPTAVKGEGGILEDIVSGKDEPVPGEWSAKLDRTFKAIDARYNGGLFSAEKHPLLAGLRIDGSLFASAIDSLCRVSVKGEERAVDFSEINVHELGGIYESLLEYKLAVAAEDIAEMPCIADRKRVRRGVLKGDLYLLSSKGDRQKTGSYYTPDRIVEHLVRTTIDPKLNAIAERDRGKGFDDLAGDVLELTVCDPAMGSGHMIATAFDHIMDFLRAQAEARGTEWTSALDHALRSRVARECVYGADLNPIAVELAKLVIWMKVFDSSKPFEFLDYNLVCGNSLVGDGVRTAATVETGPYAPALLRSTEEVERDLMSQLLGSVACLQAMSRNTIEEVHEVERYWRENVRSLQDQLSFGSDLKLARWFAPSMVGVVQDGYETFLEGVENDPGYVRKILEDSPEITHRSVKALAPVREKVVEEARPLHWAIAFPHVASRSGFDAIVTNPPWDKIKVERGEVFSDYIDGYDRMETKDAKKASDTLMAADSQVAAVWNRRVESAKRQNAYYRQAYHWQTAMDKDGKSLVRGDPNLFKVFIERAYDLLKPDGSCGIVVPDNLNIDAGATGLRRLLLGKDSEASVRELVMFTNTDKLFEIDSRYKFDVLTFDRAMDKRTRRKKFQSGFYWTDPDWLDGKPDDSNTADKERKSHQLFDYDLDAIRRADPERLTIYEFRNERQSRVLSRMLLFPAIGDPAQPLYIETYREFDMTNDADLFNTDGKGWPLYQGGTIHYFDAWFGAVKHWVEVEEGEARLAAKFKVDPASLPDRSYRIAWRSVANATNARSLICTVLPRGVFTGNSLNLISVNGVERDDFEMLSGLNAVLSSTVCDFYVRLRTSMNINAFIVKDLPVPRNLERIRLLGRLAMPLYTGDAFRRFRSGTTPVEGGGVRRRLIGRLDALTAACYGLKYEDYQAVLAAFTDKSIPANEKKTRLEAFNDILLDGWPSVELPE